MLECPSTTLEGETGSKIVIVIKIFTQIQESDNSFQCDVDVLHSWSENFYECHSLLWHHCGRILSWS